MKVLFFSNLHDQLLREIKERKRAEKVNGPGASGGGSGGQHGSSIRDQAAARPQVLEEIEKEEEEKKKKRDAKKNKHNLVNGRILPLALVMMFIFNIYCIFFYIYSYSILVLQDILRTTQCNHVISTQSNLLLVRIG